MASENLLGCMAHVINLAAKDGLQAFGFNPDAPDSELTLEQMDNPMHISNITNRPDGVNVNLKTVISRIHGLTTYVRATPQRREQFSTAMACVSSRHPDPEKYKQKGQPSSSKACPESKVKTLVMDVKT